MMARQMFKVGDEVVKVRGYPFPGYVVAVFQTRWKQEWRYVVECSDMPGLLHIFNADQLMGARKAVATDHDD